MPPGPKKRKANKKKKEREKETTNPNPNPNSDPPLLHQQENGRENHGSTDEERNDAGDPHVENGFGGSMVAAKDVVDSVEIEENLAVEEESTRNHQPRLEDLEVGKDSVTEFPIESIDAYASREKELKIVPLTDEQEIAVHVEENTHINADEGLGDTVLERSLKENSDVPEEFVHNVTGNHEVLVEEVNNFNANYEMKEDSLKVTSSDEVAEESLVGITKNEKVLVKEVDTTFSEEEVNELSRVDEDLKETQLDTLCKEKNMLTEHPIFVTEKVSEHSKATAQNLNKVLVGIVDSPFPEKGVKDIVLQDPTRSEIAPKSEIVHGPLVVRRATLWNCCGLLDVVTGSRS